VKPITPARCAGDELPYLKKPAEDLMAVREPSPFWNPATGQSWFRLFDLKKATAF